jgi:hypothetical protein
MSIYAWRWWRVVTPYNIGDLCLLGAYATQWPVGKPLHATCRLTSIMTDENGFVTAHVVSGWHAKNGISIPGPHCQCGIYAMKQPNKSVDVFLSNVYTVLGIVEIWGKIITAELGYRAEYGQIRVVIDDKHVSTVYGIPNLPSVEAAQAEYFELGKERV